MSTPSSALSARRPTPFADVCLAGGLALVMTVALAGWPAAAHAGVIGDTVSGTMFFKDFGFLGNMFDAADIDYGNCPECSVPAPPDSSGIQPSALVTKADTTFPEYIFRDIGFLDVTVDIDAKTMQVTVQNTNGTPTLAPFGWEIVISDIHWNGNPNALTSAFVVDDTNFPGLTASVISGGSAILIDYPGRATGTAGTGPPALADQVVAVYAANNQLTATVAFAPEPTSAALLVLAAVGCVMRRR